MLRTLNTDAGAVVINVQHILKVTSGDEPNIYRVKMTDGEVITARIDDLRKWVLGVNA